MILSIACGLTLRAAASPPAGAAPISVVRLPLSAYRVGVALAGPSVAASAPLLEIAQAARAYCAMNGGFFAAYPGETGEPYGTLVIRGHVVHLGGVGTRLDVLRDGRLRFIRDRLELRGGLDGRWAYPANWYAYNLNQTPTVHTSSVQIYTPERGPALGFPAELAVIVRGGRVIQISRWTDARIPRDGFVVVMQGKEVGVLGWKFAKDQQIAYRVVQDGEPLDSRFSLGAGPRLVEDGIVRVDPLGEGFRDPKILIHKGRRSAIGVTVANEILLAVIERATITEAAIVMRNLGAVDAMNLDDNGSSGLVCDGRYLVEPGRRLPNAVVVWPASP